MYNGVIPRNKHKDQTLIIIKLRCLHTHFFWIISLSKQCLCRVFLWANTENGLTISCSLVKLLTCIFDTLWVSLSTSRLLLCHTSCPGAHRHKTQPANRMRNGKQSALLFQLELIILSQKQQQHVMAKMRPQKTFCTRKWKTARVSVVLCHSDPFWITINGAYSPDFS